MKAGKYQIKWTHGLPMEGVSGCTSCRIYADGDIVGAGVAHCHPKDNYCRDTGRKISLSKVLQAMRLTKEEKKEIWEAYRTMTPNGRW